MTTSPVDPMQRRAFLAGGAMLGGAMAAAPAAEAAPTRRYTEADLRKAIANPAEQLRLYMKLKNDLSGKPVLGWYSGHVFGVEQGEITTPLLGIEGFGMGYTKANPDGSYRETWKEVGYYKDLVTDEILTKWTNPYNGVVCDVMPINNRSVNMTHVPTLETRILPGGKAQSGGDYLTPATTGPKPYNMPWFVNGDFVGVQADSRGVRTNPLDPKIWKQESSGEMYSVTEFFASYGSLNELLDPKTTTVASTGHWTRIAAWLPWMMMGQRPGQAVLRCVTKKMFSYEEVPQRLRDYTKAHYPAFTYVSTPEEAALPPESSWEVFKATRKPAQPL